jgi:hypothetical protein
MKNFALTTRTFITKKRQYDFISILQYKTRSKDASGFVLHYLLKWSHIWSLPCQGSVLPR